MLHCYKHDEKVSRFEVGCCVEVDGESDEENALPVHMSLLDRSVYIR